MLSTRQTLDEELFAAYWSRFLKRFNKKDDDRIPVLNTLLALYGGDDRYYHAYWHINGCSELVETARRDMPEWFADPDVDAAIELALDEHDVIYKAAELDNEERSAALAKIHAHRLGFAPAVGELASECVLATKHVWPAPSLAARIVCDIDLATLASPLERFCENTEMVWSEHAHLMTRAEFDQRQRGFFASMLDFKVRPSIYQTGYFFTRLERPARANLQRVVNST